jgi:hypothetical protein
LAHRQHVTAFVRLLRPAQRFYLRAVITATPARDGWSLKIAVRAFELELLRLAQGGPVAEVGTGNPMVRLLLAGCGLEVFTYDRIEPPQLKLYLSLVPREAAERVRFSDCPGDTALRTA